MEKQKRKIIFLNVAMAVILLFLVFIVFRKDYKAIWDCLSNTSVTGLLLLLGMGAGYQFLDSAVCLTLVREKIPNFRFRQAADIIFLGIFGNVLTSSAGTIPLQSYYLCGQGVQVGNGAGMMIFVYIFHKISVFFYAAVMVVLQKGWLKATVPELMKYIYMVFVLCAIIITALVMLCTWNKIQEFLLWGIGKLPDTGKWTERKALWSRNLEALYKESRHILGNRSCRRKIIFFDLIKLSWLYLIPFVCIKILNIPGPALRRTFVLASIMIVIVGILPNVSGIGSAEFAFLLVFEPYMGRVSASSAMILYRIVTYFFPFVLSVGVFLKVRKNMLGVGKTAAVREAAYHAGGGK